MTYFKRQMLLIHENKIPFHAHFKDDVLAQFTKSLSLNSGYEEEDIRGNYDNLYCL